MAQDLVKQDGGLTTGKPAVERVWLHPHRVPGTKRQGGAMLSLGAGENHQHEGSAQHPRQPPKLRCKSYQTSPKAGYPSAKWQSRIIRDRSYPGSRGLAYCISVTAALCYCGPGQFRDINQRKKQAPHGLTGGTNLVRHVL